MTQARLQERLQAALEPEIESLGFELVELTFASEASRRILRVMIDSPHGVSLEACAGVSRKLAPVLEAAEDLGGGYYLEVSSPGINRPLTKPEHFRRFLGERVKIRLHEKLEGGATLSGILRDLQGDRLTVETTVGIKQLQLAQIARARLHRDLDQILKRSSKHGADTALDRPEGRIDAGTDEV